MLLVGTWKCRIKSKDYYEKVKCFLNFSRLRNNNEIKVTPIFKLISTILIFLLILLSQFHFNFDLFLLISEKLTKNKKDLLCALYRNWTQSSIFYIAIIYSIIIFLMNSWDSKKQIVLGTLLLISFIIVSLSY